MFHCNYSYSNIIKWKTNKTEDGRRYLEIKFVLISEDLAGCHLHITSVNVDLCFA